VASGRVGLLTLGGWRRVALRKGRLDSEKRQFVEQIEVAARAERHLQLAWKGERELSISAIVDESEHVRSFYLTDRGGAALPTFESGQYLTCHFPTAEGEKPLVRCYSLSDRPREECYRLTVKRQDPPAEAPELPPGRASHQLHQMEVGDKLCVAAPRGAFFLDPRRDNPVVLVAGGIGVTPLVSMLASLDQAGDRREVYFVYGVRNSREHPFREELEELTARNPRGKLFIAYSQPLDSDREQVDYHLAGRITVDFLQQIVPPGRYDYYLCGPGGMMRSLVEGLVDQGVPEDGIRYEAFGPASLKRRSPSEAGAPSTVEPRPKVRFQVAEQEVAWDDQYESLLELIEQAGVAIDSGCRAGSCGMCATRVLEGDYVTTKSPSFSPEEGHCLACISVPTSPLVLEL